MRLIVLTAFFTVIILSIPVMILGQPQTKKHSGKLHGAKYLDKQRELLKMSLFCKCLYSRDSLYYKNDATASELFQMENYDWPAYDKFKEIIQGYKVPKAHSLETGKLMITGDCLFFYKSEYLDSAVKSLDKYLFEE